MEAYFANLSQPEGSLQERPHADESQRKINERWAAVSGFAGLYEVSSLGRIRRTKTQRLLRPFVAVKTGQLGVDLRLNKVSYRKLVGHVVALEFLPTQPRGTRLAYRSDDVTDNRPENLEWLTPSEYGARCFVERDRGLDGRFLEKITEAMETQAAVETAKGWK